MKLRIAICVIARLKKVPCYQVAELVDLKNCHIIIKEHIELITTNKIKKGRRTIREQHYRLRPHDLVKYQNQIWQVKGVQNRGKYIKLTKELVKDVVTNIKNVAILLHVNGCLISLD